MIEILYEDDYCIAVNKPNNCLIHNSFYARNIKETTLLEHLKAQTQQSFYPIHRLDYKTSGIILLAKQKEQIKDFQALFEAQAINKTYLGLVRGFSEAKGIIDTPVKHKEGKQHRDALTHFETLAQIELPIAVHPYETSRYSLVKLQPKTGRTHQLRIHMNKISHPLVGDYKYGDRFHNRMFEAQYDCHYLFLHAYKLDFKHPFSEEKISLKASLPNDWNTIFKEFNWSKSLL